jgi:hypothetical protein
MAYIQKTKRGVGAIETESPHPNFYAVDDGLAVFKKPDGSAVIGTFQNSYFPLESSNFRWISARCKLKTKADAATTVYIVTALYGIRPDGKEELIAEDITSSISTSETTKDIIFNVASSSSTPDLSHVSQDGATSGKLYMNLPARWKNFDEIKIGVPWLTGWSKCSPVLIPGSNLGMKTAIWPVATVEVAYRSGMKSDFSDVRFVHPDGKSYLCSDRVNYQSGVSATFNVLIDVVPGYPYVTGILMFYGKSDATDKSSPSIVYKDGYYFNFENGSLSGWYAGAGTLAIDSSSPISGGKSVKHTGNGTDSKSNYFRYPHRYINPYYGVEYDFKFKILNQGTGTNSPYFYLIHPQFYDANNFFWVDFNYAGGVTYVRLGYRAGGSDSAITQTAFMTGKVPTGTIYHINVSFNYDGSNNHITVVINGTQYISWTGSAFAGWTPAYFAHGSNIDGVALWDEMKIRYIPIEQPGDGVVNAYEFSQSLVAPDGTPGLENMQLVFTRPGGTIQNLPIYAYVKEKGIEGVYTNILTENSKGICQLGYDSIDKYIGFRFKPLVQGDKNCNVEFSEFTYEYEVLK